MLIQRKGKIIIPLVLSIMPILAACESSIQTAPLSAPTSVAKNEMVDSQNNITKKVLSECAFSQNMWKKTLTSLSSPTEQGWAASDGFASVALPDGTRAFFTGDTLYGTVTGDQLSGGEFKRGMILVYDPKEKNCWKQRTEELVPTDTDPKKQWHWAGTPIYQNSLIALPLARQTQISEKDMADNTFNFKNVATDLGLYHWTPEGIEFSNIRTIDTLNVTPDVEISSPISWTNTFLDGDTVYIAGTALRPG